MRVEFGASMRASEPAPATFSSPTAYCQVCGRASHVESHLRLHLPVLVLPVRGRGRLRKVPVVLHCEVHGVSEQRPHVLLQQRAALVQVPALQLPEHPAGHAGEARAAPAGG